MIRLLALILIGVAVPLIVAMLQRRWKRLHRLGQGLMVSYITILIILGAGEIYFRYFHVDSAGRYVSSNWVKHYWHLNSQGFRDREWRPADWVGKKTIAVIGDSFTAGWGINNPEERFSEVLARNLGERYAVFNLGVMEATPPVELSSLHKSPDPTPDIVILQYFLNDIESALLAYNSISLLPSEPLLVSRSALANYIYTQFDTSENHAYWAAAYEGYDNNAVWRMHTRELDAIIDHVESIGARLIVVIFPNLRDPAGSARYVDRVAQFFDARGQRDILNLNNEVATWTPQALTASPRESHPSAALHHRVGEMIYAQFFS